MVDARVVDAATAQTEHFNWPDHELQQARYASEAQGRRDVGTPQRDRESQRQRERERGRERKRERDLQRETVSLSGRRGVAPKHCIQSHDIAESHVLGQVARGQEVALLMWLAKLPSPINKSLARDYEQVTENW